MNGYVMPSRLVEWYIDSGVWLCGPQWHFYTYNIFLWYCKKFTSQLCAAVIICYSTGLWAKKWSSACYIVFIQPKEQSWGLNKTHKFHSQVK